MVQKYSYYLRNPVHKVRIAKSFSQFIETTKSVVNNETISLDAMLSPTHSHWTVSSSIISTQHSCRLSFTFGTFTPFIHSFIHSISIAPLAVCHYSEALTTQHG